MRTPLRAALTAALALLVAGPAAAQEPVEPAGPETWQTDNVEYLGAIKQDVGLTTGARVVPSTGPGVPDRLFVASGKNFTIYDITDPAKPVTMGKLNLSVAWEGEEVPTNGSLLAISTDYYSLSSECVQQLSPAGCVQFYDVRDAENIKLVGAVPAANHTSECTLDCTWFYGSDGSIIDASGALEGKGVKEVGNWIDELRDQGVSEKSCHHVRELRPGVLLTACQPFSVMSILPEDGGSPEHPKLLYTGEAAKFVHSARWPRQGRDQLVMIGGEQNFTARCERNNSEFSTYSAKQVLDGDSTEFQGPIEQLVPTNGTYTDGNAPAGELGCSVHWFQEHPSFKNGGLVALAEYENGVKFLQITKDGGIEPVGYFIAAGSSANSPKWAPDGKTLYVTDYHRGLDIIRWNGDTYVPNGQGKVRHRRGAVRGSSAEPPLAALRASRRGQARLVTQLRAAGWVPGYCRLRATGRV